MNTLLILLALSCLCCFSTSFIFGPKPPPRQKRDCKWMSWKSFGNCDYDKIRRVYRMERKRDRIPARYGGRNCVGPDTNYRACKGTWYVASRFVGTVLGQQRGSGGGGSAKRVLTKPGSTWSQRLNPCTKPHTDPAGNVRMLGKACETRTRRRRSADGYIELYEEPLRESIRVKRQTTLSTKHRDILFLLDESGSVGPINFKKEVRLAKAVVGTLCGAISVGKQTTRVGILGFDKLQHPLLNFLQYFDRADIFTHMNHEVKYAPGDDSHKETCMVDAFEYARTNMLSNVTGARTHDNNVEQVIVFVTDGCSECQKERNTDVPALLKSMRKKLEKKKIPIITFFIGNLQHCNETMQGLADGAHCYQVFRALSWGELDEMSAAIEGQQCMDSWQIGPSCPTE